MERAFSKYNDTLYAAKWPPPFKVAVLIVFIVDATVKVIVLIVQYPDTVKVTYQVINLLLNTVSVSHPHTPTSVCYSRQAYLAQQDMVIAGNRTIPLYVPIAGESQCKYICTLHVNMMNSSEFLRCNKTIQAIRLYHFLRSFNFSKTSSLRYFLPSISIVSIGGRVKSSPELNPDLI